MQMSISEPEEIKINMTAMIDIVFQLLVFFIMTFKVVAMEGDFNIKMPLASESADSLDEELPDLITVRLEAGENGNISSIIVDDSETLREATMFPDLTNIVEERLAADGDPEQGSETEVEFDIAYNLKYSYTVKAIGAVSGKVLKNGDIKTLVKKVKFKDVGNGF
ncbi:biopolymer transporter ExbD [bacterium]|jgi:biopolymer transport protein ExbD|nr:biopolymer transporter ExbD [Mariniblastus sp.]MDB4396634.1 biopolymer transporter ExbD [bacterium]MDB4380633.1 biopolymer transporter ExbD [Mariniblastus sp.]MDB4466839.1 biopolymer transporter ExbD [bacterium]MDB4468626.1 biopolymer transporter ExbD [bacterium]